jgi:hypothetical protein
VPNIELFKRGIVLKRYHTQEERHKIRKLHTLIKSVQELEHKRLKDMKRMESFRSHHVRKYSHMDFSSTSALEHSNYKLHET